jgi:uncharacterized protein
MASKREILQHLENRQYPIPDNPWQHYQERHGTIMLHWKIDAEALRDEIPAGLELDLYEGQAYVSIVAFTVCRLSPRLFPPLPFISNFNEINLRTYVIKDGKPGIYFLSIEAGKWLPAILARLFMGLPYRKSVIHRAPGFYSGNGINGSLELRHVSGGKIENKSGLDYFLTERHCLYEEEKGRLFRIDIHHKPWEFYKASVWIKSLSYKYCKGAPNVIHFSPKIRVLLWNKVFLD